SRTAAGIPPGRLWSVAGRHVMSTFGRSLVSATSSRARAPQPTTRTRGWSCRSISGRDAGTGASLVYEAPSRLGRHPGVPAIRVRPDRHPELLVQWRTADEDDVVVTHLAVLERLDDDLHVGHGGRQQRRHPEDGRLVFGQRVQELVSVGVDAEVDDLEPGALEHHPAKILADVVYVARDRADDDLAHGLCAGLGEERPKDRHPGLHRVRGEKDLGHEQDAVAEVDAHDLHAGDERVVEDLRGAEAAAEEDRRPLHDLVLHAVIEVVVHLLDELVVGQGVEIDVLEIVRHGVELRIASVAMWGGVATVGFHIVERCGMMELSDSESRARRYRCPASNPSGEPLQSSTL